MTTSVGDDAFDALPTEAIRADLADLDLRPTADLVRLVADDQATVPAAVAAVAEPIAAVVDAVAERMRRGGRLIYAGAGTGGRLGVVDAVECGPTFGLPPGRLIAAFAGGDAAIVTAREHIEDDAGAGRADVERLRIGPADALVGISASGRTPYVLGAVAAARDAGALTAGVASVPRAVLSAGVDLAIEVVTGPELIAGSTRLKAGTAQKVVLNAISTLVMVRLGRTYGNLMVEVVADNTKLRRRAVRIVAAAAGVDLSRAENALTDAGGDTKVAIVGLVTGTSAQEARRRLNLANGHVRAAISVRSTAH